MARLSTGAANTMLSALAAVATSFSLHDGDPGTTGANELSGGDYARQTGSWGSPSSGSMTIAAGETFDVPEDTTVRYWGAWSSGGTFQIGGELDDEESYTAAGQYILDGAKVDAS